MAPRKTARSYRITDNPPGKRMDMSNVERTTLPSEPCRRCAARGWCGHDGRVPE